MPSETVPEQSLSIREIMDRHMLEVPNDEQMNGYSDDEDALGDSDYPEDLTEIHDDYELVGYIKELAHAKCEYDKIKGALEEVRQTGYGVVEPRREDLELGEPEIIKQGGRFGVKIRATAPSLHIMRVDVQTEVTPIVGTEDQSQDLAKNLMEQFEADPSTIWDTNILGRSLYSLIGDNINSKLVMMPVEAQKKMRKTLGRIVNEGKGGVICILL